MSDHESLEDDRLENPWSLSKQTSQATKRRQFLSLFMKKIGWPRLYVFLLKTFKAWILKKFRILFWPSFSTEEIKIRFSSIFFCFASFDSFKALTGCLKTFKIYRNDLVFKQICPSHVLRLECLFRCYFFYTQTSSLLFIEQWLDLIRFFFVFWAKKNYSIWSEAALLSFFIGSIHFIENWLLALQVARGVKGLKCFPICSACVVSKPIPVQ